MDSLLKDLAVSGLRVTKVHEFIQQLVDYDKVISDTLLLQLLKVFRENLGKTHQIPVRIKQVILKCMQ